MRLLISTPLQILLVDPFSGKISVVRTGDGYYYGISHKENIIVLTHSWGPLGYFVRPHSPQFLGRHLIQPHQVEWVEDKILVANTGRNCISVFADDGRFLRDVYFNETHWDDKDHGRLGNHFNSVYKHGDEVFVVAHNYERPSEVWVLTWPELKIAQTITTKAYWAHNIWKGEFGLVVCNSKGGSLQEVVTGETLWASGEDGVITRGLAISKDYIFVGCSTYNERKERYWKDGGVWIINRHTLRTVRKLVFPGSGDVQEIRLVGDGLDEGHYNGAIPQNAITNIRQRSISVWTAYLLRMKFPVFRRDIWPVSPAVRTVQMFHRWRMGTFSIREVGE